MKFKSRLMGWAMMLASVTMVAVPMMAEAKRLAEEAVQNASGELDLAKAQSELAELVAQLAAIRRLRKK